MKIVLVGATGNIGKAVDQELSKRHDLVRVAKNSGEYRCDIGSEESIKALFEKIGSFDALVSTTGITHLTPFEQMTNELYQIGLQNKLMGQVNLVLIGRKYIRNRGSFTLTSGILARDPIASGSSSSMVNGALESFVKAASIEMTHRINCVSPTILTEAVPKIGSYFRGFAPVSASTVALAYSKSVEGLQTGQIYIVE